MLIPVRCMSCGRVVGHLWERYKKQVESGEEAKRVLDELGLKSFCCRALFVSHIDLAKQVSKYKK